MLGLYAWSICSVYMFGLYAPSICSVYMLRLYAPSICLVYLLGLYAWSICLVYMLGLYAWSICLVYMLGLYAWSICLVYMLGLYAWSICCLWKLNIVKFIINYHNLCAKLFEKIWMRILFHVLQINLCYNLFVYGLQHPKHIPTSTHEITHAHVPIQMLVCPIIGMYLMGTEKQQQWQQHEHK